ncbi:Ig-like domain-containing protein [Leifsonia poae]|uniref:Bacterial Ig domain-containing protein n=1 Tax=Leifsonia poae TaxID=110933 RepID=A0A9W6LYK2_9MICO|nr:Ig-like domain-containing protein [Leifsonia poae]GLJ74687.1 hypothetical protein GCM10017584_02600 [Leifsonia poae]
MKRTVQLRAVALPVVVALGIAGAVLVGAPANAATPEPTSVPTPSTAASAAPTAAPAPASTATPTARPSTPTAHPAVSPAPSDLIVTSPTDMQEIHGTVRAVSIVGRAPVGATITVSNWSEHALAHGTADATGSFSIPLTFASTDSYDQYLVVTGTSHGRELTEQDIEVIFDAPASAVPVLATPATGSTVDGTPAPFADPSAPFTITVTGTATAGDSVFVSAESAGAPDDSWFSWSQIAETDSHGRWSTVVSVGSGRWSITASAQRYNSDGEPLTVQSDESAAVVVLIDAPAGYLAPPVITTPAYPSDESTIATPATTRFLSATTTTRDFEAKAGARPTRAGATVRHHSASPFASADSSAVASGDSGSDETDFVSELDDIVREQGIQVSAAPDPSMPGNLRMTVAGTGTPGQGVQLYLNTASKAFLYFEGLYPDYFGAFGYDAVGAPATTPPTDDGSITVAANGTWTTTVSVPAGPYFITAFGVDRASTPSRMSLAAAPVAVNLTAAAVAPAGASSGPAQPTLAATGLDSSATAAAAVLLLAGGAAALAIGARRRRAVR